MNKLIGTMIRKYRLEKNYSQEGLCKGVCAVSYLSKIEQGSVEASPEILQGLLHRLGESFDDDPSFLEPAGQIMEEGWQQVFCQGDCPRAEAFIQANRSRLLHGPYLLDALLLEKTARRICPNCANLSTVCSRGNTPFFCFWRAAMKKRCSAIPAVLCCCRQGPTNVQKENMPLLFGCWNGPGSNRPKKPICG